MARISKSEFFVVLLASAVLVAGASLTAQQNTKRLVLKDGSYQTVTKWEIKGDRLRYLSAERNVWEELPATMVDWPATEKYNQESEEMRAAVAKRIRDDEAGKEDKDPEPPPTVAPGLRLPDGGGVFLLDTYQNQPQLVEVAQNGGQLNHHTGRNILRAAINPLALSSKQTIELEGERAKVQSHVTQPTIYVSVESAGESENVVPGVPPRQRPDWPAGRYGIVRLDKKNGMRVVGNLNVSISGKVSEKQNWIKTTSSAAGDWARITPAETLTPGEYAVVELLDKGQINLFVWDFGVDPSAPANPNAWTPRRSAPSANSDGPVLERRPKF
jgi:hypothetical protein